MTSVWTHEDKTFLYVTQDFLNYARGYTEINGVSLLNDDKAQILTAIQYDYLKGVNGLYNFNPKTTSDKDSLTNQYGINTDTDVSNIGNKLQYVEQEGSTKKILKLGLKQIYILKDESILKPNLKKIQINSDNIIYPSEPNINNYISIYGSDVLYFGYYLYTIESISNLTDSEKNNMQYFYIDTSDTADTTDNNIYLQEYYGSIYTNIFKINSLNTYLYALKLYVDDILSDTNTSQFGSGITFSYSPTDIQIDINSDYTSIINKYLIEIEYLQTLTSNVLGNLFNKINFTSYYKLFSGLMITELPSTFISAFSASSTSSTSSNPIINYSFMFYNCLNIQTDLIFVLKKIQTNLDDYIDETTNISPKIKSIFTNVHKNLTWKEHSTITELIKDDISPVFDYKLSINYENIMINYYKSFLLNTTKTDWVIYINNYFMEFIGLNSTLNSTSNSTSYIINSANDFADKITRYNFYRDIHYSSNTIPSYLTNIIIKKNNIYSRLFNYNYRGIFEHLMISKQFTVKDCITLYNSLVWNNITDTSYMFYDFDSTKHNNEQITLNEQEMNIYDIKYNFSSSNELTSANLYKISINYNNVTDFTYMFELCNAKYITSIINGINPSIINSRRYYFTNMFYKCKNLNLGKNSGTSMDPFIKNIFTNIELNNSNTNLLDKMFLFSTSDDTPDTSNYNYDQFHINEWIVNTNHSSNNSSYLANILQYILTNNSAFTSSTVPELVAQKLLSAGFYFSNATFLSNLQNKFKGLIKQYINIISKKIDDDIYYGSINSFLKNIINFDNLFENINISNLITNDTSWNSRDLNVRNVNDFSECFKGCTFNEAFTLNWNFNPSFRTTLTSMFSNCITLSEFNLNLNYKKDYVYINYMFNSCSGLTVLNLTIPLVYDMSYAFNGCTRLTTLDLSSLISSIDMTYAFNGCSGLTTLDLSSLTTASNITNAFNGCSNLNDLKLDNLEKIETNLGVNGSPFNGCTNLTTLDLPNVNSFSAYTFSASNIFRSITLSGLEQQDMSSAFSGCTNLTTLDLSSLRTASKMSYAFNGCSNLHDLKLDSLEQINTDGDARESPFTNCTNLTSLDLPNVKNFSSGVFSNLTDFTEIKLGGCVVQNMTSAFYGCSGLTSIYLPQLYNGSNMIRAFEGCTGLTNLEFQNLFSAGDMSYAFYGCSSLKTVTSTKLHTVSNMTLAFINCSSLETLDLSSLTTASNMQQTFERCTSLTKLSLESLKDVNNMEKTFYDCAILSVAPVPPPGTRGSSPTTSTYIYWMYKPILFDTLELIFLQKTVLSNDSNSSGKIPVMSMTKLTNENYNFINTFEYSENDLNYSKDDPKYYNSVYNMLFYNSMIYDMSLIKSVSYDKYFTMNKFKYYINKTTLFWDTENEKLTIYINPGPDKDYQKGLTNDYLLWPISIIIYFDDASMDTAVETYSGKNRYLDHVTYKNPIYFDNGNGPSFNIEKSNKQNVDRECIINFADERYAIGNPLSLNQMSSSSRAKQQGLSGFSLPINIPHSINKIIIGQKDYIISNNIKFEINLRNSHNKNGFTKTTEQTNPVVFKF